MGTNRRLVARAVVLLACSFCALEGRAQIIPGFLGSTPTWVRPQPDGLSLSTVTAAYHPIGIRVSVSGNFSFTAATHGTFDNVEFLYNSSFNPSAPLTGLLRGVNAVGFGGTESMTAIPLTSNTLYYVVTTGFSSNDSGPIVLTFNGPSSVTQVFPPALPGDYSVNGKVDGADYVRWRDTFGANVSFFAGADGNGSGAIDDGDYGVWRANFGRTSGSGADTSGGTAVPEPSTGLLMLAGTVALCYAAVVHGRINTTHSTRRPRGYRARPRRRDRCRW